MTLALESQLPALAVERTPARSQPRRTRPTLLALLALALAALVAAPAARPALRALFSRVPDSPAPEAPDAPRTPAPRARTGASPNPAPAKNALARSVPHAAIGGAKPGPVVGAPGETEPQGALAGTNPGDAVNALGRIEPQGEIVAVAAPEGAASARIKRMLVREGDTVAADAVIAVLDSEDRLKAELETAERRVSRAERLVAQARASVDASRGELVASIAAARATERTDAASAERQLALYRASYLSRENADLVSLKREAAGLRVRELEARLARFERSGGEFLDVAVALEDLAVARAALAEAHARLAQAYVRAPSAGTVLDVHRRAGEGAAPGALIELGALDAMYARLDVYETDVGGLSVGQAARLTSAALSVPLCGRVERIGALVRKQSVVDALPAANTDARVVEVLVRLDERSAPAARRFVGLQVLAEVGR